MIKQIKVGEETYAILVRADEAKDKTEWFGEPYEALQVSRMKYPAEKVFKTHHHIMNPRIIKATQEAFVVISGRIEVYVFNKKGEFIEKMEACAGEAVLLYRGGHGIKVIQDCVVYEIKAGQFSVVSEDKEFI